MKSFVLSLLFLAFVVLVAIGMGWLSVPTWAQTKNWVRTQFNRLRDLLDEPDRPISTGLETKSPAELRDIAARYHLKITGKAGNTWERIATYLVIMAALTWALLWLIGKLPFQVTGTPGMLFKLGLWAAMVAGVTWGAFLVEVPKLVGVTALNLITKRVHVFTQGYNIRFFWEQVTANDYLTLRSDIITRTIATPTRDTLIVKFETPILRWRVFPQLLLLNASHSTKTISAGATEIFETVVGEGIGQVDIKDVVNEIPAIQTKADQALESPEDRYKDIHGSSFQEQYGVSAEKIALGVPTLPQDYREAQEGRVTMEIYKQSAQALVDASRPAPGEPPTLKFRDALDLVMLNAKENVTKAVQVFRLEADEHIAGLANGLAPAIAAAARALTSARGPRRTT